MTTHTRSEPVIVTRGLTRHFTAHKQTVEAVRGLDLDIAQGELVAFLGPNGAGKSTTLRMLTTLLPRPRAPPSLRATTSAQTPEPYVARSATSVRATVRVISSAAAMNSSAKAEPTGCVAPRRMREPMS